MNPRVFDGLDHVNWITQHNRCPNILAVVGMIIIIVLGYYFFVGGTVTENS